MVQKLLLLYTNTYSLKFVSFTWIQLVTKDTIRVYTRHPCQKASNTNNLRDARTWFIFSIYLFIEGGVYSSMFRKKSKYKHVKINKTKYYFYKISWVDITADGGHATREEFDKFECSKMVTFAYIYKKTKKFIWTFASYDEKDEVFSDRNIFPIGCIVKMQKLDV